MPVDITPITDFLLCRTPQAWIDRALREPVLLLIDHANCEKKAASTAALSKPLIGPQSKPKARAAIMR